MTAPGNRSRRRGRVGLPATLAAALLVAGCLGPDPDGAAEQATERVRGTATATRDTLHDVVTARDAPRGADLLEQVHTVFPAGPDVIVFHDGVRDGDVIVRAAFHARGETRGGLDYAAIGVRLCAEFVVTATPPGVELADTACPEELPRATGNAGNIDRVVTLRD